MAYTPIDDADFNPPIPANDTTWTTLVANDDETVAGYEPGMEANTYPEATTAAREFRFMVRGLQDNESTGWVVGVYAEASSGSKDVTVYLPGTEVGIVLSVSTAGWYETNGGSGTTLSKPVASDAKEIRILAASPSPQTLAFSGIRFHVVESTLGSIATKYPSGYRFVSSYWSTANRAIPSEVVSRLRNNPARLAIERPVCVFFHCSDTVKAITTSTKVANAPYWGAFDATTYQVAGRGLVPYCDRQERQYTVDAYTTESVPRVFTEIAAASDGNSLPQTVIDVDDTSALASSGRVVITTQDTGPQVVSYSGSTATTLTGCSGGTGTLSTNDVVHQGGASYSVEIGGHVETWAHTGWRSWTINLAPGMHDIVATINPGTENGAAIRILQVWRR